MRKPHKVPAKSTPKHAPPGKAAAKDGMKTPMKGIEAKQAKPNKRGE